MSGPDVSRRPRRATEDGEKVTTTTETSVTAAAGGSAVPRPSLSRAEVYEIVRGRLAAHVIVKDWHGHIRCRSYVNLRAADRAVQRAHARGCAATVVMVRQDVAQLIPETAGGER